MKDEDFEFLGSFLAKNSGLSLTKEKAYLLETRLSPVSRSNGLTDISELVNKLRLSPSTSPIARDVVNAMTTNETLFFRDGKPFEHFRTTLLKHLLAIKKPSKHIRIWSMACSSGQEPYSLAMIFREMKAQFQGWRIEILGTDLSTKILEKARLGLYTQFEVQRGLPITLLVKEFSQEGDKWKLSDEVRSMVEFRPFNVLDLPRPLGRFDVILCRNLLIYFSIENKKKVLNEICKLLTPGGIVMLGSTETVLGLCDQLKPIPKSRASYQLVDTPEALRLF